MKRKSEVILGAGLVACGLFFVGALVVAAVGWKTAAILVAFSLVVAISLALGIHLLTGDNV